MIFRDDIEYDLERERQERCATVAAADITARLAHQELADRYADRAWGEREARCEAGNAC